MRTVITLPSLPQDAEITKNLEDYLEFSSCNTLPHMDRNVVHLVRQEHQIVVEGNEPADVYAMADYLRDEVEGWDKSKKYPLQVQAEKEYKLG